MTRRANRGERRADVDPEPITSALERFTRDAGLEGDLALVRIREAWTSVVGPILADRASPERLKGGVLHVACDHGATANEVTMLQTLILERACEVSGTRIESLAVKVRRTRRR